MRSSGKSLSERIKSQWQVAQMNYTFLAFSICMSKAFSLLIQNSCVFCALMKNLFPSGVKVFLLLGYKTDPLWIDRTQAYYGEFVSSRTCFMNSFHQGHVI